MDCDVMKLFLSADAFFTITSIIGKAKARLLEVHLGSSLHEACIQRRLFNKKFPTKANVSSVLKRSFCFACYAHLIAARFAANHPRDLYAGNTPRCSKFTRNRPLLVREVTKRMRISVNKVGLYEYEMH